MLTIRLGRSTTMVMLAAALLAAACGDDDGTTTAETGADDGPSTAAPTSGDETAAETATEPTASATAEDTGCAELPQLHVVNDGTGNAVEEITMLACDMSDQSSFPVPPGGLPDGGDLTIDLPGPGCWVLEYAGEGCFGDPPGMVEAECGETVEWVLNPKSHVCAGF